MKLSVVIPTYNRCAMLLRAVSSVCRIKHRPLEVIVVDDGSTDGTAERSEEIKAMCAAAGAEFQFISQENAGAASARNKGWDHATGDLIQWVDSDDIIMPEGVEALIEALKKDTEIDLAYGLVRIVDGEGRGNQTMGKESAGWETDYFDYLWHTMGAVYRRDALEKVGRWNPKLSMPDDWEFSSRTRIAGCRYRFVDVTVGNYVNHGVDTLTTTRFDAAKCYNVVDATLSLRNALLNAGKFTPFMRQRCFNRILVHALELASKKSELAKVAFARSREVGSPNVCLRILGRCLSILPPCFVHREVFLLLRRDSDGTLRSMLQSGSEKTEIAAPQRPHGHSYDASQDTQPLGVPMGDIVITAICPTFNRSGLVIEAVKSFLTSGPAAGWEVIVVDDGSQDDTLEKVEALQSNWSSGALKLLRQPKNLGAPRARNEGLRAARGRYVLFLDSDDIARPEGIRALVASLETGNTDYAYGKTNQTIGAGDEKRVLSTIGSHWQGDLGGVVDLNWHTMGAVYRKKFLLERVGEWNEKLAGSQDWEYQARVKLSGARGIFVDVHVGDWRQDATDRIGANSYSRRYVESVVKAALAIEAAARSAGKLDAALRRRLALRLVNHALEASANKDTELAAAIGAEARRLGPGFVGGTLLLLLRLLPAGPCVYPLFKAARYAASMQIVG